MLCNKVCDDLLVGLVSCEGFDSELFVKFFPEFSSLPNDVIAQVGNFSSCSLNLSTLGKCYNYAVALLTCHRLYLRFENTASSSEELSFAAQSTSETTSMSASTSSLSESKTLNGLVSSQNPTISDLARTNYGLELLGLINSLPVAEVVQSPCVFGAWNVFC